MGGVGGGVDPGGYLCTPSGWCLAVFPTVTVVSGRVSHCNGGVWPVVYRIGCLASGCTGQWCLAVCVITPRCGVWPCVLLPPPPPPLGVWPTVVYPLVVSGPLWCTRWWCLALVVIPVVA